MDLLSTCLWTGGVCLAFIAGRSSGRRKKEFDELQRKVSSLESENAQLKDEVKRVQKEQKGDTEKKSYTPAKEDFIKNIDRFLPYLNSLVDGSYNSEMWTDNIIDINNEELMDYWKKIHNKQDSILRLLAMWGIKHDDCNSFVGMNAYVQMYETTDGTPIESGKKYKVIKPCWMITSDRSKKTLLKGIVEYGNN